MNNRRSSKKEPSNTTPTNRPAGLSRVSLVSAFVDQMSILQRIASERLARLASERLKRSERDWNRIRMLWAGAGAAAAYVIAGEPPVEAVAQVAAEPWDLEKGLPFVGRELKVAHEPPEFCYKTAERATRLVKHSSEHALAVVVGLKDAVKPLIDQEP